MTAYPESVSNLIDEFARLPGIGRRSAERLAFFVLKSSSDEALGLARSIARVKESVRHCSICWNLADIDPCPICSDPERDASVVLVVEQPRDLISLEQTGMHAGVYHVLLG
ncbi:MAG: recombination protein RecR, partial [Phycisphaeraceae bacterium]|nr:recombination protein RecR [Phycisphaeraceae bacterium]